MCWAIVFCWAVFRRIHVKGKTYLTDSIVAVTGWKVSSYYHEFRMRLYEKYVGIKINKNPVLPLILTDSRQ